MTPEEIALIRQLLEEKIHLLKVEQRQLSTWQKDAVAELGFKIKLAESALRSLDRLELPRESG